MTRCASRFIRQFFSNILAKDTTAFCTPERCGCTCFLFAFLPAIALLFFTILRYNQTIPFQNLMKKDIKSKTDSATFNTTNQQLIEKQYISWSWRDSNPRPNEELMSFLHAYLRFDCRVQTRPKPPICTLVSKFSSSARNLPLTISDIIAPPFRNASEQQQPGDVLSPQLLRRLS